MYRPYPTRSSVPPLRALHPGTPKEHPDANPWALWRPEAARQREILTVAEVAECRCPDLCNRDHANE